MSFNHGGKSFIITVNQKNCPQKAILENEDISELSKRTDTHLSEPANGEDGFAMAPCWQTVLSILTTIHRQKGARHGKLQVNLCPCLSHLMHGIGGLFSLTLTFKCFMVEEALLSYIM